MGVKKTEYTTIQIRKDINQYIRKLCKDNGWIASTLTEKYWIDLISGSVSSSLQIN